jgi:hypothetical protein
MSGQFHSSVALSPVPTRFDAGWAPNLTWTTWRGEKSCPYQGLNSDPLAFQPVAGCCTDCTVSCCIHLNVIVLVYTNFVFWGENQTILCLKICGSLWGWNLGISLTSNCLGWGRGKDCAPESYVQHLNFVHQTKAYDTSYNTEPDVN